MNRSPGFREGSRGPWQPGKSLLPVLAVAHRGHEDGADGDEDLSE